VITLSLAESLGWTQRLAALAVALQTLELLKVRRVLADDGVWRWDILQREHAELPGPLAWLFARILPYRELIALLWLRVLLSVLLALGHGWAALLLFVSQLAICVRFRGTFNGGSDYMTMVVLSALTIAGLFPRSPTLVRACLGYVCAQLVLSYVIAGVAKLRQGAWWNGSLLKTLVATSRYGTPSWLAKAVGRVAPLLSWLVMLFECAFPIALAGPRAALAFTVTGALFHLGNALTFGLNRFLFAWAAAYPALLHFSGALAAAVP
jgi:hypothetical protein